jgi:hypothetical protein
VSLPQPGCVPLRPLGLGDILDGAFTMIRRNPRLTLGLSALVAAVQMVIVVGIEVATYTGLGRITITSRQRATASTGLGPLLGGNTVQLATVLVGALLGALLTGMLTVAITQDVLGVRLSLDEVWRRTRPRLWALVAVALVTTVCQYGGLLVLIAPGVWLWGIWAVAIPALMVEGTGVRGALRRSRALVRGSFWRVWSTRAVGVVVVLILNLMITVPFAVIGLAVDSDAFSASSGTHHAPLLFAVLTAVGSAVATAFSAPIRAGVDALLYVDLRMRREGLDIILTAPPGAAVA